MATYLKRFGMFDGEGKKTVDAPDKRTAAAQLSQKLNRQVREEDLLEEGFVHENNLVLHCPPPEQDGLTVLLDPGDAIIFAIPHNEATGLRLPNLADFDLSSKLGLRKCAEAIWGALSLSIIASSLIWWQEPATHQHQGRKLQQRRWRPLSRVLREWEDEGPEE